MQLIDLDSQKQTNILGFVVPRLLLLLVFLPEQPQPPCSPSAVSLLVSCRFLPPAERGKEAPSDPPLVAAGVVVAVFEISSSFSQLSQPELLSTPQRVSFLADGVVGESPPPGRDTWNQ